VEYYRFAKSEIWAQETSKKAADAARERHEYRELRIEREKQEKAEKLAAKEKAALEAKARQSEQLTAAPPLPIPLPQAGEGANAALRESLILADPEDTMQLKIQAAIDHAKQQAAVSKPENTEHLTPQQQAEIATIEARRARIRELALSSADEHTKE
jgi:electron transport complex protein RnfC